MKLLDNGLEVEKNGLIKEYYFDKENVGHFYEIFVKKMNEFKNQLEINNNDSYKNV